MTLLTADETTALEQIMIHVTDGFYEEVTFESQERVDIFVSALKSKIAAMNVRYCEKNNPGDENNPERWVEFDNID